MPNNKKIGNQTGSVPLPTVQSAGGSFVSNEVARFVALNQWPKPSTGLVTSAGDYIFALSSGTVTGASGTYGFLVAYGSEVSRTLYPSLFDRIGTNYGDGDGTSSFNLPEVWGDYGYLKGASTPSGVTQSGCLPILLVVKFQFKLLYGMFLRQSPLIIHEQFIHLMMVNDQMKVLTRRLSLLLLLLKP